MWVSNLFRSSWYLYPIANTTEHPSIVTVTVISTTSNEGSSPIITMTTTNTKCQSFTNGLIVTVLSILLVVIVITGIAITALVLVVIVQRRKIQLLRYICH